MVTFQIQGKLSTLILKVGKYLRGLEIFIFIYHIKLLHE